MSTGMPPGEPQPSPEELAMMEAMIRRLAETPVRDVVMQTMATFADMAAIRLGLGPEGAADADLPQARLAIEALRGLLEVAEEHIGPASARPFREPLAALQMAFARAAEAAEAARAQAEASGAGPEEEGSGLWTPPGAAGPGPPGGRLWTPGSE
ncbi:MAG: DUF1844 domain-containing protein [Thermoleophilia bacterium]|jgi:hypothetical protein|nr:DUF1844 domain-containing protein [Thermoleophilia bacterium]